MGTLVLNGAKNSHVYWLHHSDHTDMFTQGYVGVSHSITRRFASHRSRSENNHLNNAINKYGWDNLVKDIVLTSTKEYCLDVEAKLRPTKQIGWNITNGGGMPPSAIGKVFGPMSAATKVKVSASKKASGFRHAPEVQNSINEQLMNSGKHTRFKPGQTAPNKGKPRAPHLIEALRMVHLGSKHTQEHKDRISKGMLGRIVTQETREKIRAAHIGKTPAMKGKHYPTVKCPHCDVVGGLCAMKQWHFSHCKLRGES